jgi:hypothetical protein
MDKVQVSQDQLLQFITEHNIKLARLSELTGLSDASITSCFNHQLINGGVPRSFTAKSVEKINAALEQIATELRGCLLTFGSERTFTNQRKKTYDPALVEPIRTGIARYFKINQFLWRVVGWNLTRKHNVLETNTGKAFGCITKEDADRINTELLSVMGVLNSYQVVADKVPEDDAK